MSGSRAFLYPIYPMYEPTYIAYWQGYHTAAAQFSCNFVPSNYRPLAILPCVTHASTQTELSKSSETKASSTAEIAVQTRSDDIKVAYLKHVELEYEEQPDIAKLLEYAQQQLEREQAKSKELAANVTQLTNQLTQAQQEAQERSIAEKATQARHKKLELRHARLIETNDTLRAEMASQTKASASSAQTNVKSRSKLAKQAPGLKSDIPSIHTVAPSKSKTIKLNKANNIQDAITELEKSLQLLNRFIADDVQKLLNVPLNQFIERISGKLELVEQRLEVERFKSGQLLQQVEAIEKAHQLNRNKYYRSNSPHHLFRGKGDERQEETINKNNDNPVTHSL